MRARGRANPSWPTSAGSVECGVERPADGRSVDHSVVSCNIASQVDGPVNLSLDVVVEVTRRARPIRAGLDQTGEDRGELVEVNSSVVNSAMVNSSVGPTSARRERVD